MIRNFLSYWKPLMPMLMGLCIGLALSLILTPFAHDEECHENSQGSDFEPFPNKGPDKTKVEIFEEQPKDNGASKDKINLDYWISDDFEPRRKEVKIVEPINSGRNLVRVRPRYISTELGIREKIFVGVLTSRESLDTLGVAVNKTLSQYVTKLVFFMYSKGQGLPSGIPIVLFTDEKKHLVPFYMFKYIGDHYVKAYDWFFFLRDDTYVRGNALFNMVNHISVSKDLLMGHPQENEEGTICDLGYGILVSQAVMNSIVQHLDWCMSNVNPQGTDTDNVGRCLLHSSPQTCTNKHEDVTYRYFRSPNFNYEADIEEAKSSREFHKSFTISKMKDDTSVYKLHRYFCEKELKETKKEILNTEDKLLKLAPSTPDRNKSLSWPLGVEPPTQPRNRFDVIRWDYFTESHIYFDSEMSNIKELRGVNKEDVNDVIATSMTKLGERYSNRYSFKRLINGYRRFDAARGMEYTLDLELHDRDSHAHTNVHKRVHLLRPLSNVEIVPMPYVTENSRVNLILPVQAEDKDNVVSFLDSYAHTCLESGDNTYLFVVFMYGSDTGQDGDNDIYSVLKSMITFYENKYQNGARIAWTAIHNKSPTQYTIMDAISRKFPPESLFLVCTVGMELSIEFLNRVRMNTISNWQVFFPIAFWQYKPNLVYEEKPYPTTIDINAKVGHYDIHSYAHASFYNSDYQYARKQMISTSASSDIDIFDMFLKFHNVHVFRAVEPALKIRFSMRTCSATLKEDAYHMCLQSKAEGLASRSQLAMLIFEHQQKLDRMQLNVMHQQQGANVVQMKPDMLRK